MFLEKFPYRVKFYTKGRFGHTCGVRVLRIDRPLAGGFLSLTALQAEGCGGALRAQIIKEGGAAGAAGCVEGLRRFRSGGRQPFGPRVMVAPFGRRFYKKEARPIVISTVAERSGEIPSDGTGGITLGDLSTQSFINAFSICPIPTCISARDDDVGERPSRHFDRSEAEWRNLPL